MTIIKREKNQNLEKLCNKGIYSVESRKALYIFYVKKCGSNSPIFEVLKQ